MLDRTGKPASSAAAEPIRIGTARHPLPPIAFGCEVLRRLIETQSRQLTEDGPAVVLVEDIETMLAGLELAGSALGLTPAPISPPAALRALPAPRPRSRQAGPPKEDAKSRRLEYQRAWRAAQKAKAANGHGAPA